jgi:tripeptide aminopeptidase
MKKNNSHIVDEFCELVRIDTKSRDERNIANAVISKLKQIGFKVEEDHVGDIIGGNTGNIFAVLEGNTVGSIFFSSHLDRVANGTSIRPIINDSCITSDGTTILAADDVSGIVAIIDGVRRIKESGKPHPRIEIVFTVCEEKGILGSKCFDFSKINSKFGYVLDSPGRIGRIVNAAPSKAELRIEVSGKASHAGNAPEKGANAIIAASKILANIKDGRIDEESTANFAIFKAGGDSTNVVCDYAEIVGEARSLNQNKLKEYLQYFEEHCRLMSEGTNAKVKTHSKILYSSFHIDEDKPSINLMKHVLKKMNINAIVSRGGGGMDANHFNAHDIECVGLATGYTSNHSFNESIEIKDLILSGEMVGNIILEYNQLKIGEKEV